MDLIKRNIHMDCVKCRASTQMTLEDDINISDSRPDAAKLIMDRGNVVIEELKVTDDHVTVKGKLVFHVLYLTEDKRTDIAGMEGNIPFEEQIYMEGIKNGDLVHVDWELEDLSIGLINSRKLSVQSVLSLHLKCEEICDEETAVDLYCKEPVEYRKKTLNIASMAIKKKDIFRVKEEVEIPGSHPNIFSMIWTEIVPSEVEFKVLTDKISIQGDCRAFFLYRGEGEEEEICHHETTIPFSGSIECNGCREGMVPEIRFVVEHKEIEVRPDFDGEERVITFELCLELDICIYEEESVDILSDVYGVTKEITVMEKEAKFRRLLSKCSGKSKISNHFKMEKEGIQLYKILHTSNGVQITNQSAAESGIEISGMVNLRIFYESNSEMDRFGVMKVSMPFHYVLEAEGVDDSCLCPLTVSAEQMTVSIIDTGEVDVKCMLYFRANVYKQWKEKIVEQVQAAEADMEKLAALPGIAIYVVKEGESLWDIGKRYYVPVSVIKHTNEMNGDEVRAGDRILIVKGMGN